MDNNTEIDAVLNDDTKLTEITRYAFDSVDTDGSGYIEHRQFDKVLKTAIQAIGVDVISDTAEVMQALRLNQDAKISQDEFKVLIKRVLASR